MKIQRTKERIKKTGEIFTPPDLVQEVLNKLPRELFQDATKTFLDNSCGEGAFLVYVLGYKLAEHHSSEQALSTIYGVDLMPDNVEVCKQRLLNVVAAWERMSLKEAESKYSHIVASNIVCANALTYDYSFGGQS